MKPTSNSSPAECGSAQAQAIAIAVGVRLCDQCLPVEGPRRRHLSR